MFHICALEFDNASKEFSELSWVIRSGGLGLRKSEPNSASGECRANGQSGNVDGYVYALRVE